jgi:hypothetical protein
MTQWEPYDNTAYIPSGDDIAYESSQVTGPTDIPDGYFELSQSAQPIDPPPGRSYAFDRAPPTWQHASLGNIEIRKNIPGGLMQAVENSIRNTAVLGATACLAYMFTKDTKKIIGSTLGMWGIMQVFSVLTGSIFRPFLGVGAIAGAYFLVKPGEYLENGSMFYDYDEGDDYDDEDDEDDEANDDDVDELG